MRNWVLGGLSIAALVPTAAHAQTAFNNFGSALAAGDFNGDGKFDLAVGDPANGTKGRVTIFHSGGGTMTFTPDTPGIAREGSVGNFGAALAAGDFNGDGAWDLAIGNSNDTCNGNPGAGSVTILYGVVGTGLTVSHSQRFTQDHASFPDVVCEDYDHFGFSLVAGSFNGSSVHGLAIGVPYEDIGSEANAGLVHVIYGAKRTSSDFGGLDTVLNLHQDLDGFESTASANDLFGYSLASGKLNDDSGEDLVVGIPGEQSDMPARGGAIEVMFNTFFGFGPYDGFHMMVHKHKGGIEEDAATDDRFGAAVAIGKLDGQRSWIAVGVPGRNVGTVSNAGQLHLLPVTASSNSIDSTRDFVLTQNSVINSAAANDSSELNDGLGSTVTMGDFDNDGKVDIAAMSAETVQTGNGWWPELKPGAVHVFPGSSTGVDLARDRVITLADIAAATETSGMDLLGFSMVAYNRSGTAASELVAGAPGYGSGSSLGAALVLKGVDTTGLAPDGASLIRPLP